VDDVAIDVLDVDDLPVAQEPAVGGLPAALGVEVRLREDDLLALDAVDCCFELRDVRFGGGAGCHQAGRGSRR